MFMKVENASSGHSYHGIYYLTEHGAFYLRSCAEYNKWRQEVCVVDQETDSD